MTWRHRIAFAGLGVAMGGVAMGCAPELRLSDAPNGGGGGGGGAPQLPAPGGEVQWARSLGGERAQAGPSVAVAGDGAAVLLGKLTGSLGLDGQQVTAVGAENVFWARLASSDGAALGLRRFGAFDPQIVNAIAPDVNGDLLVAGEFSGRVEFGGSPRLSVGGRDGYVVRLDPEGQEQWLQLFGGVGFQAGTSAAGSIDGGTVVAGRFSGTLQVGAEPLVSAGSNDVFVASFDIAGAPHFSRRFGDGFDQRSRAVAVDAEGNVVIVGDFAGEIDFGGGPLRSAGDYDVFVAQLGPDGQHRWSARFGDAGPQRARAVAVDGGGNIIVGGEFAGAIDFGGGPRAAGEGEAVFVLKLGPSGEHRFSRRIGEQGASLGQLLVDGAGNALLTGSFEGQARFGGGLEASAGGEDVFVVKLDPDGAFRWSRRFGGPGADRGTGVALDPEGAVFVTGAFSGGVEFGDTALEAGDGADVFLVKLSP